MVRITSVASIGLTLLSTLAAAGEAPSQASATHAYYFVCIASPAPNGRLFYASRVFEDSSRMGQTRIQDSFRQYLIEKYGYPEKHGRVECPAGPTASEMEEVKKDRVRQMDAVETDWSPGA